VEKENHLMKNFAQKLGLLPTVKSAGLPQITATIVPGRLGYG
jgi:hypothetical protein